MKADVLTFALISVAGSLIYVAVVVALHFLPTGYQPGPQRHQRLRRRPVHAAVPGSAYGPAQSRC